MNSSSVNRFKNNLDKFWISHCKKYTIILNVILPKLEIEVCIRGVAMGVYNIGIYTPKSAQVNFYGVKMTSERLFNSFIPPKNFYTLKTNFCMAAPLVCVKLIVLIICYCYEVCNKEEDIEVSTF